MPREQDTPKAVREGPIIFSAPMVRAILAGAKTQTRRPVKLELSPKAHSPFKGEDGLWRWMTGKVSYLDDEICCPYGEAGDRLWVRETFLLVPPNMVFYRADGDLAVGVKWKPSIYMPRAASRITIEVTGVRAERLHQISEADARAEGVTPGTRPAPSTYPPRRTEHQHRVPQTHVEAFLGKWDEIHGAGAAEKNPWCWVIEFRRCS